MFIWQTPPTWFNPFDQHERMTARSSAQVAMCGSQSDTQIPLWPCCFHLRREASSGERPSPIGVMTGLKLERQRLAGQPVDLRLGVERVDVTRPAFHEQEDHAPGRRGPTPRGGRDDRRWRG